MKKDNRKKQIIIFIVTLIIILAVFVVSVIKTEAYNRKQHEQLFAGPSLFTEEDDKTKEVSVMAVARGSTWTKVFDFNNEGLTEHNYQAYTYDFTFSNNTKDAVESFGFKLTFSEEAFLSSGWNGAVEIHQNVGSNEIVSLVPDLREFNPDDHPLETVTFDGENLIPMQAGDYFIYIPSSSMNALEMPIEPTT